MNKFISLAFLIVFFSTTLHAQEKENSFGFKAGINYSNYTFGKNLPSSFPAKFYGKIGFHLGVLYTFQISDSFSFQPELLFSSLNAEYKFDEGLELQEPDGSAYKIDYNENMILLPLIFRYNFNQLFDIELGPQLGYSINQTFTGNSIFYDIPDVNYDKFEFGLNAGLGISFSQNYRVGIRYGYAITERNNTNNYVFQLGLQYNL